MKILYCVPKLYNAAGIEQVLTQKVNWLAAHTNHTFLIATTELTPQGKATCAFALDKQVEVIPLDIDFDADYTKPLWSKWWGHMRRMKAYRQALTALVREKEIDLCISLGGKEIAFLKDLPCRTMAEMHFAMRHREQLLRATHRGFVWALLGKIRTVQLVRVVKPLERLVVLTESDKAEWNAAGCKNVVCVPNICSLDGQKIPRVKRTKTVLAVGRLHEQKGFDLLLEAWQKIETRFPEWTLRIVGEGHQRAALEAQINGLHLQRAVLAGQAADIKAEYASASLFVLSSRYEGFSLVLSEAMWSGVPCVAFDCPQGPAELLADERGWLVPNGDVEALHKQIAYAITHPEEATERAQKAQAFAQATYSEACIMPQWIRWIERPRRIAYINESINTGSVGHIIEKLGRFAQENGYECVVAHGARYTHVSQLPHYAFSSKIEEYLHGVWSLFGNAHGLGSRLATRRLIRYLDRYQPDIVHLHNIHGYYLNYPLLFDYLKRTQVRVVWTLHDCWPMTGRCAYFTSSGCEQWKSGCAHCPAYKDYPRSLVSCGVRRNYALKKESFTQVKDMTIVPVSRWLEHIVRASYLAHYPVQTIYNGIDTELFRPMPATQTDDRINILGVASQWTETKGWSNWLQLAQALDDSFRITLVGVTEAQKKSLPSNCVGITRTDNIQQLVQLYSCADIYVNLAHQEAFGLTLLEAMSCGTPCISYRTTAIPETTTPETCICVPDGDLPAVLKAIETYGKTAKAEKGELCRAHVVKHFSEQRSLQQYLDLYQKQ